MRESYRDRGEKATSLIWRKCLEEKYYQSIIWLGTSSPNTNIMYRNSSFASGVRKLRLLGQIQSKFYKQNFMGTEPQPFISYGSFRATATAWDSSERLCGPQSLT